MDMKTKADRRAFADMIRSAQADHYYPFFHPVDECFGPEVTMSGRRLIMIGSNDYLGLSHDPRVMKAAADAVLRWGTGPGGSRFLSGSLRLHEQLEERLSDFVGKRHAIVHTTGFLTNLGVLGCLLDPKDFLLCDHECHASIFEGCRSSPARMHLFPHNSVAGAAERLRRIEGAHAEGDILLVTDGVFSMSGDVAPLADLVALKKQHPRVAVYLDDAHGLGVLGPGGRGTARHAGVQNEVDYIMGTFSKAFASIGGFVATDDEDTWIHMRHRSKSLMFSAALPAANVAAVIACLDILASEPERVERLHYITRRVRDGYRRIGLHTADTGTPIVPILIGDEFRAYRFAAELFEAGVFAMPAVFPAVPKGQAIIRTAYMSTHEERHVDQVLGILEALAVRHRIRVQDSETSGNAAPESAPVGDSD